MCLAAMPRTTTLNFTGLVGLNKDEPDSFRVFFAAPMTPIHELLHRIQWDPHFGHGSFMIGYYDRMAGDIVRIPFRRVHLARGEHFSFDVEDGDGRAHMVPFHRVREVWRNGELIWQRIVEDR